MVRAGRGDKSPSEMELYGRSLRTPQETRQKGKRSETVQFQSSRRNIIFVNREENHLLCVPFLKPQNLLSFCSKNRFEYLTQNSNVYNDVYNDDLLSKDDCMRRSYMPNVKSYPKNVINKENKLSQDYTCKKNINDFNVMYMKEDVNK